MKTELEMAIASGMVTLFWYTSATTLWYETFVNGVSFSVHRIEK